jgi:putative Mn2+ efflux pump MntP
MTNTNSFKTFVKAVLLLSGLFLSMLGIAFIIDCFSNKPYYHIEEDDEYELEDPDVD